MTIDRQKLRRHLAAFDFRALFIDELGWDHAAATVRVRVDGGAFDLTAVAEKRGVAVFLCPPAADGAIPDPLARRRIEKELSKSVREHVIIFTDAGRLSQRWQWVRREAGRPQTCREYAYHARQPGDSLIARIEALAFGLEEEERLTLVDVRGRTARAFDVERVTKRFYDLFKKEHDAFAKFLSGIPDEGFQRWYVSVMLNRLMFIYFIEKKGFLAGDPDYLAHKLAEMKAAGKDRYYADFLCPLFFEGFAKEEHERDGKYRKLLGKVPYLNGGIFQKHEIETAHDKAIRIPDKAFEGLFAFFDAYRWHLDERPLRADNEINPDVLGYIFEKYINQKMMGAYYTKEDITEYISKSTVIPRLVDMAREKCKVAFEGPSSVWSLLAADPDRYIYPAVRHGVVRDDGSLLPESDLPDFVRADMVDPRARMSDARYNLQQAPAGDPVRLVTETWREYAARRERCLDLRRRLTAREACDVNDLITLNLDIRQFAQDVIQSAEGPEIVRAFWRAIAGHIPTRTGEHAEQGITILDPACGSGAFLFAALNILEPLYEACLDRMRFFVEELDAAPSRAHPWKLGDFREILKRVDEHPNERYFVLKSIILNNLFGVDIMEEATEICKLRLFLKLVAQVEPDAAMPNFGIEPLPDIDFNIRAGNSLVGFATYKDVQNVMGKGQFDFASDMRKIETKAADLQQAFDAFRRKQLEGSGGVPREDKERLKERLAELDGELNRYLATEYGIDPDSRTVFTAWLHSHRPFHWFVEFYGIVHAGGFDVAIGNPPYVEYSTVKRSYSIRGYLTEQCGNLYAFMWERCMGLAGGEGQVGMIQPVASVCTDRYEPLQALFRSTGRSVVSNFNDRPSKLFDGLEHIRLCIVLLSKRAPQGTFSTQYSKWQSVERPHLFQKLAFTDTTALNLGGAMAKVGAPAEASLLTKVRAERGPISDYERRGRWPIYYTRKLSHFVQILDFIPAMTDARGAARTPSELKTITFASRNERDVFLCILNSSLFYWLLTVYSDCRNLNRRDIGLVRFDFGKATGNEVERLHQLCDKLMADMRANSKTLTMRYADLGHLRIQCTYPKHSKGIIDVIDHALANHYDFTDAEADFIINYDIKYRMGSASDEA